MNDRAPQPNIPRPLRVPFVDLLLDRRTDILAFAAFVLALSTVIAQIVFFLKGPRVSMLPPNQITMIFAPLRTSDSDPDKGAKVLRVSAQMGYVNSGEYGQTAVVIREWVSFRFDNQTYVQKAHSIQNITDLNYDNKLEFEFLGPISPLAIAGVSSASRPVYFSPFPVRSAEDDGDPARNFLLEGVFLKRILEQPIQSERDKRDTHERRKPITISFFFQIAGDDDAQSAECTVNIDQGALESLVNHGWTSLICWPPDD